MRRDRSSDRGFSLIEIMIVVGITCVVAVISVPMMANTLGFFRLSGDARSVSNSMAVAKMRAASVFSRTRLHADLVGRSHYLETWDKTLNMGAGGWKAEGGTTYLSSNVNFTYSPVTSAPPNTQGTISQAAACTDDMGMPIGNTACLIFNSRGVPVRASDFSPTVDAIYVSDGTAIYGVTVVATGMIRLWRTNPAATPTWVLN